MTDPVPFLIPGDLQAPTGGYAYARALIQHGAAVGLALEATGLPGDFPFPSEASLERTAAVLAGLPPGRPALVDGLAFGALPARVLDAARGPLAVLLHHPLGFETGVDAERKVRLIACEAAALRRARAIVVPSAHVAAALVRDFAVDAERITVATPGTQVLEPAPRTGSPPVLLSAGTITPRKGHDVLVAALEGLVHLPWTARFVGSTDRDPAATARLRAQIAEAGLDERIALTGSVPETTKRAHYHGADLFVLASHYEGYGMVFAEAMVAGLPIVATTAGAVPDLVPAEAGLLVAPGDVAALREAIEALLTDRRRTDAMAAAARRAGTALPRWDATAATVKTVLDGLRA